MKISVSLPEADVRFLDEFGDRTGAESRSSVLHAAIDLLRAARLEEDYAAAWQEWDDGEDAQLWESTLADGVPDAAR